MYSVHAFNPDNGEIVFKFDDGRIHSINLYDSELKKYEGVNNFYHYLDVKLKTIVRLSPPYNGRLFTTDNNGNLFKKATQYDYDNWMTKEFPDSDNAKIFRILIDGRI